MQRRVAYNYTRVGRSEKKAKPGETSGAVDRLQQLYSRARQHYMYIMDAKVWTLKVCRRVSVSNHSAKERPQTRIGRQARRVDLSRRKLAAASLYYSLYRLSFRRRALCEERNGALVYQTTRATIIAELPPAVICDLGARWVRVAFFAPCCSCWISKRYRHVEFKRILFKETTAVFPLMTR